jgi:tetratricopeptide (TPR) repeat protein
MGLIQPTGLPPLIEKFLAAQPVPEALHIYTTAGIWISVLLGIVGQKHASWLLLERIRQVALDSMDLDLNVRANVIGGDANYFHHIHHLPYRSMVVNRESARCFLETGNRPLQVVMRAHEGKALLDLGQRAEARAVLEANLALAEQLRDDTPLSYARAYMARLCASSDDPIEWARAEEQATKLLGTQNLTMVAQAQAVLARVHWQRGDLATAESEARAVSELLRSFACYRPEVVALWSRILTAQGKVEEALQVCQEGAAQAETLGLKGSGQLNLYAALADAHLRCGNEQQARAIIERALPILQERVNDIPDPAMRSVYLRTLPENVRLLELAVQWGMEHPSITGLEP